MLQLARLQPGETLADLGSGDGRLLIAAVAECDAAAALGCARRRAPARARFSAANERRARPLQVGA